MARLEKDRYGMRRLNDAQVRFELGIIARRVLIGTATDDDRLFLRELDFEACDVD